MLPSVQCFLTFSGLSTTVLNPSASANLKPRVAEKRLNMEWIWGQQNRMGCGLACSWHTHAATFLKSFLAGIFGYKICPFVTAGIQPWCSCCQLTQEWPSNCHVTKASNLLKYWVVHVGQYWPYLPNDTMRFMFVLTNMLKTRKTTVKGNYGKQWTLSTQSQDQINLYSNMFGDKWPSWSTWVK